MEERKRTVLFALASLISGVILYFFYLKYVPLVPAFQAAVLPVFAAAMLLTAWRPRRGTLFFIFFFPLINNWSYLFGIDPGTPQAPAALILFLFYLLGWIIHGALSKKESPGPPGLSRPMAVVSVLVMLSAVITWWRFANFWPFLSDRFYELVTNVNGVTAGGAAMSVVFCALNYLTGFAFFVVLWGALKEQRDRKAALITLAASLLVALPFGFYQHFFDPAFGNTAFWVEQRQINATFKDPNAFGATLAMLIPLFLGAFLVVRKAERIFFGAAFILGLAIFPFIGARSAFLGLGIGLASFGLFSFRARRKALLAAAAACALLAGIIGASGLIRSQLFERVAANIKGLASPGGLINLSPERFFLWKEAAGMAANYPPSGVGVGAYIIELPNYYTRDKTAYSPALASFRRNDSAENYFLQVAAEMGAAGLAAFLWLFWMLGKEIKRGFRSYGRAAGQDRLLFAAGTAGMIAFGINILFHSYIGSFETNYTFWLLTAVTLRGIRREEGPDEGKKQLVLRRTLAFSGVLFVVFSASHLWNSSHSLSLRAKTAEFRLAQAFGLYPPEKTADGRSFRWTREYAGVPLKVDGRVLLVPVLASHPDIAARPVKVEVFFVEDFFKKKIRLGEIVLTSTEWQTHRFMLAGPLRREGILLVEVSRTWNPQKLRGVPDPRNLGVALGSLSFREE